MFAATMIKDWSRTIPGMKPGSNWNETESFWRKLSYVVAFQICFTTFPDSVLLRFEKSFMNGSSFEPCSNHFGRVCHVVASRFGFTTFQI